MPRATLFVGVMPTPPPALELVLCHCGTRAAAWTHYRARSYRRVSFTLPPRPASNLPSGCSDAAPLYDGSSQSPSQLDPSEPAPFELLDALFGELADIFPDKYLHLGTEITFPGVSRRRKRRGSDRVLQQVGQGTKMDEGPRVRPQLPSSRHRRRQEQRRPN